MALPPTVPVYIYLYMLVRMRRRCVGFARGSAGSVGKSDILSSFKAYFFATFDSVVLPQPILYLDLMF